MDRADPARETPQRAIAASAPEPAPIREVDGKVEPAFDGQYRVQLESFEGPLDLLLHLIQQHEIDILDIPISFITRKYLEYLGLMRSLAIDLASEYLVMAATLAHIKSKMLLPSVPPGQEDDSILDEEEDPRAELVRRLLEYQKYKAAAAELGERGTLGKDVFGRGSSEPVPEGPAPFAKLGVFSLLDAFEKILKRSNVKLDHEVVFDRISITDRIVELTERLSERRSMRFEDLLVVGLPTEGGTPKVTRFDLIITFLAVLEMARLKLIRVYQSDSLAPIHVQFGPPVDGPDEFVPEDAVEQQPAVEEPAVEEPVAEQPAVEQPAVEQPAVEQPAAEQPAVDALISPEEPSAPVNPLPTDERDARKASGEAETPDPGSGEARDGE